MLRRLACRLLLLAALLPTVAVAAGPLEQARALVEQRDFAAAIPWYQQALRGAPDNADLMIELARVYGWADRNRESAESYARVAERFPARRADVLPSLAWQLLWSGQPAAALPLFREVVAKAPQNREALTGLAQALNETGRHRAAAREYAALARADPGDVGIKLRLATTQYWAGHSGEALATLAGVSGREADELRARILGEGAPSVAGSYEVSRDRDNLRIDAARIAGKTKLNPTATLEVAYRLARLDGERRAPQVDLQGSFDAATGSFTGLRLNGEPVIAARITSANILNADRADGRSVHVALPPNPPRESFRSGDWLLPGKLTGQQLWLTYSDEFGAATHAGGGVYPRASVGIRDYDGWRTPLARLGAKWLPADLWRLDFELGNDIVENLDSIDNRVRIIYLAASADYQLTPRLSVGAGHSLARFDDGNTRNRLAGRLEYVAWFKPRVSVGAEGYAFRDKEEAFRDVELRLADFTLANSGVAFPASISFREAGRGYYNPKRYLEAKAFATLGLEGDRWSLWGKLALGRLRETPWSGDSTGGLYTFGELGYRYRFDKLTELNGFIGRSGSRVSASSSGGYYRAYAGLYVTRWFEH